MTIPKNPAHAFWRPTETTLQAIERNRDRVFEPQEEAILRRINTQIGRYYPNADFKISKVEYQAAKKEAEAFIKERAGADANPDRKYDRDASLQWYPASCMGKIAVDLRSQSDNHGKVSPTSTLFEVEYRAADMMQRKWVDCQAGASLERECRRGGRPFIKEDVKIVQVYCERVLPSQRTADVNKIFAEQEKANRQGELQLAHRTTPRGHLWKESDVPHIQSSSSGAVQR